MRLSWLEPVEGDRPCTVAELERAGVEYQQLSTDPAVYEPAVAELCRRRGYVARDEVALSPETPDLEQLVAKFVHEHRHSEDEVRLVLEGSGIFDIRSAEDRWMRVEVAPGDLLAVPANRYHRFLLTDERRIRCVRLFQDRAGWTPIYRPR